jgi:hypothetical protein
VKSFSGSSDDAKKITRALKQNVARALVELKEEHLLPAFLNYKIRASAVKALQVLTEEPTLPNIKKAIQAMQKPL